MEYEELIKKMKKYIFFKQVTLYIYIYTTLKALTS